MEETEQFLDDLFASKHPEHYIQLWTLQNKQTHCFASIDNAVQFCSKNHDEYDIYVGVGLAPEKIDKNSRCKSSDIIGIPGFWLDVDIEHEAHDSDKTYPPDVATAKQLVEETKVKPTYYIDSGHGLHVWWLFGDVEFLTSDNRQYVQDLSKAWTQTHLANFGEKGYDIDATFDLARLMRIPGTTNHKQEDDPKSVEILEHNAYSYDVDDIENNCIVDVQDMKTDVDEYDGEDFEIRKDASPPWEKWRTVCDIHTKAKQAFDHQLDKPSLSEYDMVLANIAAMFNWTDQEIVDLLVAHRKEHSNNPDDWNLDRPDYYRRTIGKARKHSEEDKERFAGEKIAEGEDGEKDYEFDEGMSKKDKLQMLTTAYDMEIDEVIKYPGEEPQYSIRSNGSEFFIGTVDNIDSQTQFRRKMINASGKVIKDPETGQPFKKDKWLNITQCFYSAATVKEMGEEVTTEGKVHEWLRDYLNSKPLPSKEDVENDEVGDWYDWKKNATRGYPVVRGDGYYINLNDFKNYLKNKFSERLSTQQLASYIRMYGATKKTLHFKYDGPDGNQEYWRRVWELPEEEYV